jgi:RNA polymerase subunit RPABC4/transcription elongation factor Spt4
MGPGGWGRVPSASFFPPVSQSHFQSPISCTIVRDSYSETAMTTCPECGSVAPESFGECPTCGARLNAYEAAPATEACPHCNETIASDSEACPACGEIRISAICSTHAEKPATGQCVVCARTLCDECNRGGDVHYLCEAHAEIPVMQGWAQVYTTSDDLQAQLIRENLEAEGVDARVLSQKDHFGITVDLGDFSPVRVLVPAYAYSDAANLIAEHMDETGEVRFGDGEEEPPAA